MATTMEPETRRDPGAKTPPPAPRVTEAVKPGGRRRTAFVIMGVVLVALAALGARRWIFSLSHQSTDDAQAEAQVEQAQANALKAHADLDRLRPLAEQDIVSKQQLDAAEAAARAADAALAAAQAALVGADARVGAARAARDQAALNLSYT